MLQFFARRMKEMHEKDEKGEKGFTLIELLVVVIIIGILAAIAIPTFLAQRDRANNAAAQSDLRNASAAATSCQADSVAGSYAACGTEAQLAPYGFNTSESVTYANVVADATTWTSRTTSASGQAYQLSTAGADAGEVVEVAAAPA